jgi:4-amino-4-deoxy-L-arabinose transferase-like glycosyltransferase
VLVVGALAIASLVTFWHLGTAPLADWDEACHAKIALDMQRTGEWLVYASDGEINPWSSKPPLSFYAMLASFRLLGVTELAVRTFAATGFVLLVTVTAVFVHRVLGPLAAWTTLLLMVTSRPFLFEHFARDGVTDAPLALGLAVTIYALWWKRPALATLAYAFALLVKGIAALQIVPVVAIWLTVRGDWRGLRNFAALVGTAFVPLAIWTAMREAAAPGFVANVLQNDVAGRLTTVVGAPHAHRWLYVAAMADDLPRVAAVAGVAGTFSALRQGGGRDQLRRSIESGSLLVLLVSWWLVPIAVFSIAQTKHEWYVLPSYVPAYILAGWSIASGVGALVRGFSARWRSAVTVVAIATCLTIIGGRTVSKLVRRHPVKARQSQAELRTLLAALSDPTSCDVAIFRAHEMPAMRFYLTRAERPYRSFDLASLPQPNDTRAWCIVVGEDRRQALSQSLPMADAVGFPHLRVSLSRMARAPSAGDDAHHRAYHPSRESDEQRDREVVVDAER